MGRVVKYMDPGHDIKPLLFLETFLEFTKGALAMENVAKKKIELRKVIICKRCGCFKTVYYRSLCASKSLCSRCANKDVEWKLK